MKNSRHRALERVAECERRERIMADGQYGFMDTRRFQFRLATLLGFVTVLCIFLAWSARREHQYRLRLDAFETLDRQSVLLWTGGGVPRKGTVLPNFPPVAFPMDLRVVEHLSRSEQVVAVEGRSIYANDQLLNAITAFSEATMLNFRDSDITDAQLVNIAMMSRTEELNLHGTSIGDAGVVHLSRLFGMKRLDLSSTNISGAALASLRNMSQLEDLSLDGDSIGRGELRSISLLSTMRRLALAHTGIVGDDLAYLSQMRELEWLSLRGNKIEDKAIEQLGSHQKLRLLGLARTGLSDDALLALRGLPSLEYVALDDCTITDAGLMTLAAISSLRTVVLCGTLVTAQGAEQFRERSGKASVYIGPNRDDATGMHADGRVMRSSLQVDD